MSERYAGQQYVDISQGQIGKVIGRSDRSNGMWRWRARAHAMHRSASMCE